MRLNLLNQTVIVASAVKHAGLTQMTPRFGDVRAVNQDLFKYSLTSDPSSNVLIKRVDLGELFKGLPQDISQITFQASVGGDTQTLNERLNLDLTTSQYPVELTDYEQVDPTDELGQHFVNWTRLVGIGDLKRSEVELSTLDDSLIVEAHRSVVYKGAVSIKIK